MVRNEIRCGRNQMVLGDVSVCAHMTLNQGLGLYPEGIRTIEGFEMGRVV